MKTNHLSAWEQEEYVLEQRTPEMLRHLSECAACRTAVERVEDGIAVFRRAAMEWSSQSMATRPQQPQLVSMRRLPATTVRWAIAALIPLVLLILTLLPNHRPSPIHPVAQISDDALMEQVDEQVSVAVPSSMESLTHLVSTESSSAAAAHGSKHLVQNN